MPPKPSLRQRAEAKREAQKPRLLIDKLLESMPDGYRAEALDILNDAGISDPIVAGLFTEDGYAVGPTAVFKWRKRHVAS